jgi:hypothetical protein
VHRICETITKLPIGETKTKSPKERNDISITVSRTPHGRDKSSNNDESAMLHVIKINKVFPNTDSRLLFEVCYDDSHMERDGIGSLKISVRSIPMQEASPLNGSASLQESVPVLNANNEKITFGTKGFSVKELRKLANFLQRSLNQSIKVKDQIVKQEIENIRTAVEAIL